MVENLNLNLDYDGPVKIAEDIYWIGFYDRDAKLHCNPYLIVDGDEAVVIDSGSRPDFPTVMMKILKTGVRPENIRALIYHHYDPDLCGGIPNLEDIIDRPDLKIISDFQNNIFIRHYAVSSELVSLKQLDYAFTFSSGRRLTFHATPYSHAAGSFITLDEKSGVLFTSDLFGSYASEWELFLSLEVECALCDDFANCQNKRSYCPLPDIINFQQMVMTSGTALRHALSVIRGLEFTTIAPQHGSVINSPRDIDLILDRLEHLENVGIDRIILQECHERP